MTYFMNLPIIGAHVLLGTSTMFSFQSEYIYSMKKMTNEIYMPKNVCVISDKDLVTKQNFKSFVDVCLDVRKPALLMRPVHSN